MFPITCKKPKEASNTTLNRKKELNVIFIVKNQNNDDI